MHYKWAWVPVNVLTCVRQPETSVEPLQPRIYTACFDTNKLLLTIIQIIFPFGVSSQFVEWNGRCSLLKNRGVAKGGLGGACAPPSLFCATPSQLAT